MSQRVCFSRKKKNIWGAYSLFRCSCYCLFVVVFIVLWFCWQCFGWRHCSSPWLILIVVGLLVFSFCCLRCCLLVFVCDLRIDCVAVALCYWAGVDSVCYWLLLGHTGCLGWWWSWGCLENQDPASTFFPSQVPNVFAAVPGWVSLG